MRRADRLFQIVEFLRRSKRSAVTAEQLANRLSVSVRTIYRDLADLSRSSVPIRAEAGIGYALDKGFDIPPLMFSASETEALVLGARMVAAYSDVQLTESATSALAKIEAVLPEIMKSRLVNSRLFALSFNIARPKPELFKVLHSAIETHNFVNLIYQRQDGARSKRKVRPLFLAFMIPHWLLTAWCELRGAFRNFRLDRIINFSINKNTFHDEPGKTLDDFMKQIEQN
ncbi:MAG: YafY family transcriptional regulator [Deltaproteobacteria bacterium]|nr:YafY family transcriptional regulator [Deltaproteobacteria bacterium]